jgi:uncharacterized protein YcfJ
MLGHGQGQSLHRPAGRSNGGILGDQLDQEQYIVMVIDDRTARALLVFESAADLRNSPLSITEIPQAT